MPSDPHTGTGHYVFALHVTHFFIPLYYTKTNQQRSSGPPLTSTSVTDKDEGDPTTGGHKTFAVIYTLALTEQIASYLYLLLCSFNKVNVIYVTVACLKFNIDLLNGQTQFLTNLILNLILVILLVLGAG